EALAIERREKLIRAKAEEEEKALADAAPIGAPSKQAQRRAGKKTGPDAASTRDLAKKTGMSEGRINRARKRVKELGTDVLEKVQGTDLAKPGELDALAKLTKEERKAVVEEAVAETAKPEGERKEVSAKREMRAQRKAELAGTSLGKHDELN